MTELTAAALAEIRERDARTDDKWFAPSQVLAPHNTCYSDRRKLLQHIAHLERVRNDSAAFVRAHR